ncbi:MAG: NfeD family protein [Ancrocorticia sp.]|jgi:membrane protein implicated in regulation of membrane protease activity|nr:NfeD family protein [Ancrocorticia sp.]MCI1895433.1 NfeD family protein [Ancrocorticia sp.]MCI1932106.1 NfeD family protein [Ancrocorticia sp.]MCI1963466.1 NfeD family protein [Ancrocorticia sp.]MCI2002340.1 NfeD family protein [Ancrocorticia sp.]
MGWPLWLIIAIVCLIIETFTLDFTFIMLAGGALVTTAVAVGTGNLAIQVVVFSIASVLLVLFARPWAKEHINIKGSSIGNVENHVGKPARTLTAVDSHAGRVKIGGDVWSARTDGGAIEAGADVVVVRIDGAVAVVAPPKPHESAPQD